MRCQRSLREKHLGMNSVPLGTMDMNNDSFGIISKTEAELIDKVMLFDSDADCNYLNLIAEYIPDVLPTELAEDNSCSVEFISDTCKVRKFYTDTATAVVDNHFIRSLPTQHFANMNETAPIKKTGEFCPFCLCRIMLLGRRKFNKQTFSVFS